MTADNFATEMAAALSTGPGRKGRPLCPGCHRPTLPRKLVLVRVGLRCQRCRDRMPRGMRRPVNVS
jgi:hypothetical protein